VGHGREQTAVADAFAPLARRHPAPLQVILAYPQIAEGHPMASEPLYLTILRHGETIAVDLTAENPVIPHSHIPVEERFLTDICEELARITTLANKGYALSVSVPSETVGTGDVFLEALKGLGRLIFSHLFPEPVREQLAHMPTTDLFLRLDDQLVHVPWELAFDGRDFLITKFRIGRQVLTQHKHTVRSERRGQGADPLHMLIIADPTESLPAAAEEAERLCTLLDGCDNLEVSVIGGKQARKIDLLQELNEYDLVHYAGHAFLMRRIPVAAAGSCTMPCSPQRSSAAWTTLPCWSLPTPARQGLRPNGNTTHSTQGRPSG
jgi:hypothetical protein